MSSIKYHCETTPLLITVCCLENSAKNTCFVLKINAAFISLSLIYVYHMKCMSLKILISKCNRSLAVFVCILACLVVWMRMCDSLQLTGLKIHPRISTCRKFVMSPPLCQSSFDSRWNLSRMFLFPKQARDYKQDLSLLTCKTQKAETNRLQPYVCMVTFRWEFINHTARIKK